MDINSMYIDPYVKDNCKVVTNASLNQDYFLHIVKSKPKDDMFLPNVSTRTGYKENRTIPRVHVSPTLIGCIVGYAVTVDEVLYVADESFKGGYYIYKIPFEYALRPNTNLVGDADESDEHWLIHYSEDTSSYKGELIGEFFIDELRVVPTVKDNTIFSKYYVEIYTDQFLLNKDEELSKGCHSFTLKQSGSNVVLEDLSTLNKADYVIAKNYNTTLLSFEPPSFINWK